MFFSFFFVISTTNWTLPDKTDKIGAGGGGYRGAKSNFLFSCYAIRRVFRPGQLPLLASAPALPVDVTAQKKKIPTFQTLFKYFDTYVLWNRICRRKNSRKKQLKSKRWPEKCFKNIKRPTFLETEISFHTRTVTVAKTSGLISKNSRRNENIYAYYSRRLVDGYTERDARFHRPVTLLSDVCSRAEVLKLFRPDPRREPPS